MSQVLKKIFELSESRKIQKKKKAKYSKARNTTYKQHKATNEHCKLFNHRLKTKK